MEALVEVHDEDELQRAARPRRAAHRRQRARSAHARDRPRAPGAPACGTADRAPARGRVGHRDGRRTRPARRCRRRRAARRHRADARSRAARRRSSRESDDRCVKICGVTRAEDAAAAARAGRRHDRDDPLGAQPALRRSRGGARRVREVVPAGVPLVGVFVDEDPDTIDELVDELRPRPRPAARLGAAGRDRALRRPRLARRARRRRLRGARRRARGLRPGLRRAAVRPRRTAPTGPPRASSGAGGRCCSRAPSTRTTWRRPCGRPRRSASTPRAASSRRPGIKDHERLRRFVAAAKEA